MCPATERGNIVKRHVLYPMLVGLSGLAFVVVCLVVWCSRGRNRRWLAWKLRLGGVLLGLTFFQSGCGAPLRRTCYKPAIRRERFQLDKRYRQDARLRVYLDPARSGYRIRGVIRDRMHLQFSFCLMQGNQVKAKGPVQPDDGKFDNSLEKINFQLPQDLPTGEYVLHFFAVPVDMQKYRPRPNAIAAIRLIVGKDTGK